MISRKLAIALLVVTALALAGCDYFRPAQPEVSQGLPSVPTDYSSPEATLVTLQFAIQDKSATTGQSAYIDGFANLATDGQGFTATFDPVTVARFPPTPDTDWTLDREQLFYSNLSRVDVSFQFSFGWGVFPGAGDDVHDATTATLYRSYTLRATPDQGATYVDEALGNAELHFVLVGNKWKIVKWIDTENPHADVNARQWSFGYLRLSGP